MATTATDETLIRMQRPQPTPVLDPVTLTITERRGRLVAEFFDADDESTGETPHLPEMELADVVKRYEDHGWRVVGAEELIADRDRWRAAFESLHARILRDLPGDASELPQPDDPYWARTLDDLVRFAGECNPETETAS